MGDGSCKSPCLSCSSRGNSLRTADLALSQKLAEELKYEQDANAEAEEPEFLTAFKKRGVWEVRKHWPRRILGTDFPQIENVEGSDEVALTRKFGNER